MTKILRPNRHVPAFAENAEGTERTLFGLTTQSNDLTDNLNENYQRGWGVIAPAEKPTKQDFNALAYTQGQLLAYLFQMGIAEWNEYQVYQQHSISLYNGTLYISLQDDNSNQTPATSKSAWQKVVDIPDATLKQKGLVQLSSAIDSNLETVAATSKAVKTLKEMINVIPNGVYVGEIRLMPFRANELPFGWYFMNGDTFLLSSLLGQVLNSLSPSFKSDWRMNIANERINLPTAFYEGRGLFFRAIDGKNRQVGSLQGDAIRNITGYFAETGPDAASSGAFTQGYRRNWGGGGNDYNKFNTYFDAARVVPVAEENRPLNVGMTPSIYLGV